MENQEPKLQAGFSFEVKPITFFYLSLALIVPIVIWWVLKYTVK